MNKLFFLSNSRFLLVIFLSAVFVGFGTIVLYYQFFGFNLFESKNSTIENLNNSFPLKTVDTGTHDFRCKVMKLNEGFIDISQNLLLTYSVDCLIMDIQNREKVLTIPLAVRNINTQKEFIYSFGVFANAEFEASVYPSYYPAVKQGTILTVDFNENIALYGGTKEYTPGEVVKDWIEKNQQSQQVESFVSSGDLNGLFRVNGKHVIIPLSVIY